MRASVSRARVATFDRLHVYDLSRGSSIPISTTMAPDAIPDISIERLIDALDRKLLMACAQVQSAMPPVSSAFVSRLAKKVWLSGTTGGLPEY